MQDFPLQYARIIESILRELEDLAQSSSKSDADAVLLKLYHVFGTMLASALQLVDKGSVARISLPGNRHIYQVSSTSGAPYTVLPASLAEGRPYCPCVAFMQSVLLASEQLMCKHILAARLAMALGKTRDTAVSANAVAELLR
ncbi:hypothetical protein NliqN6_2068 [Naganishia liquefaciens]|uniref:SWIM-type domain-containing protein n=1 Tax=Naganishia liquefaciens TaxID=104408 RepID=A0A8H3TQQ5_9TREE|nr:hypothetical protein NliqN6_2068 [Naganishia liquefaciens]